MDEKKRLRAVFRVRVLVRVEDIIYDAMQDTLGDELEFWKAVAAVRERRERNETLH
jgi:hypothetical protein